jgi:hypothetical protein
MHGSLYLFLTMYAAMLKKAKENFGFVITSNLAIDVV